VYVETVVKAFHCIEAAPRSAQYVAAPSPRKAISSPLTNLTNKTHATNHKKIPTGKAQDTQLEGRALGIIIAKAFRTAVIEL